MDCGESGDGCAFAAWIIGTARLATKRAVVCNRWPSAMVFRQSDVGIAVNVELYGEGKTRLDSGYASDTFIAVRSGVGNGLAA